MPPLTSIGLSARANLVYRYLATSGPQRVVDIGRVLGLAGREVRLALDELSDIDAARATKSATTARMWHGQPADRVATDIRRRLREAALAAQRLNQHLAGPDELGLLADRGRLICGPTPIQARLLELVGAERVEHMVMNPDPAIGHGAVLTASPVHKLLVDNNIAIKELGVPVAPEDATDDLATELAAAGAQFRESTDVPAKFMIFDRKSALVRLGPPQSGPGVLEIADEAAVARLVCLFLERWERAGDYRPRSVMTLTERERDVLELMAQGHTDATTAAALGLSVRTITYTVSELMSRYGVRNRFQLGLVLGTTTNALLDTTNERNSS
jgi:DNA-binding CsgD family transcriptional regulator